MSSDLRDGNLQGKIDLMRFRISSLYLFILLILIIFAVSSTGPPEQSLGSNVRLVYLHGAWVWTSLLGFIASGVMGIAGFLLNREALHNWSLALGRSGLFFWITYLPISLWAMELNWNGLFLEEPRWRVAIDFAIVGILFQIAIFLLQRPRWGSLLNIFFISSLGYTLLQTDQVMHPNSPIASSGSTSIQNFFAILILLCLAAGLLLTRWLFQQFAHSEAHFREAAQ
jgi:hypothetical protein